VKLLLENGARPDFEDSNGTPLSWAARSGHERVVKLLLEHGARPDFNVNGQTPLSQAKRAGKAAVVELLDSYHTP
jgi:ankyrin repeat protein